MPRLVFSGAVGSVPRGRCGGVGETCPSRPSPLRNIPSNGYLFIASITKMHCRNGNSVPGKCRRVKGIQCFPLSYCQMAAESIFPHMAKGGASPHIIPLSSSFDWSIDCRIDNDRQVFAHVLCRDAVSFCRRLILNVVERAVLLFNCFVFLFFHINIYQLQTAS